MEQLKSKQVIEQIEPFNAEKFQLDRVYLWVWNPLDIPPHTGISVENAYFSLKWNGKDEDVSCDEMIQRITRKNIPVLALQLMTNFSLEDCRNVFNQYDRTIPNSSTCINPIKVILQYHSVTKLSELLEVLRSNKQIRSITGFNLTTTSIELPDYSLEDIHEYLQNRIN